MKKSKILLPVSLFFITTIFYSDLKALTSDGIISLLSPSISSTKNKEQVISGRAEIPTIKQVNISVEPFTVKKGETQKLISVGVINGYFSEKIRLFPGLNILKVSTAKGKSEIAMPVFLITQQKKETAENWGALAQIVFTSPSELKTNSQNIVIKGVVTSPDITVVDAVIMNTMYFLSEDTGKEGPAGKKIDYKSVPVKNMQFEFNAGLTEGLNVILARPNKKPAEAEKIQIMSLVYEKVSGQLYLDEPELDKGNVIIRGKVSNPQIKNVRLNMTALVESELKPGVIAPKNLLDTALPVEKDGSFYLETPLKDKKGIYTIKYSPTITVFTDNASATRTLIKWQE